VEDRELRAHQIKEVEPLPGFERPQPLSTHNIKGLKVDNKNAKVCRGTLCSKSSNQTS